MGKYFGTDGFRGEANITLTVEHAYKVGRFLGWYYGQNHKAKVVIGKDTRRSSYMFEYSLVSGLTASGADVYLLHVTTTPSVSYVTRTEGFDCGIMISASHNPFYDNGIKVINGKGHKLEASVEELIEQYIDDDFETEVPFALRENIGEDSCPMGQPRCWWVWWGASVRCWALRLSGIWASTTTIPPGQLWPQPCPRRPVPPFWVNWRMHWAGE